MPYVSSGAVLGALPVGVTNLTPDQYNSLIAAAAAAAVNAPPVSQLPASAQPFDAYTLDRDGEVYVNAPDFETLNDALAGRGPIPDPSWSRVPSGNIGVTITEDQRAALALLHGQDPSTLSILLSTGPEGKGFVVDPAKLARVMALETDPWVVAQFKASGAGNPSSAHSLAIASATRRVDYINQAISNAIGKIKAGANTLDAVAYVNSVIGGQGEPPLTADEANAVLAATSPYVPHAVVTVTNTPTAPSTAPTSSSSSTPAGPSSSTGTTAPPAAAPAGPSASANYPVQTVSVGPSDITPPNLGPPPVDVELAPAPSSNTRGLWIAGAAAAVLGGIAIASSFSHKRR